MQKLFFEQIGMAPASSVRVGIYPANHGCPAVGWHVHPEYEVVYIKNGSGLLNIRTKQLEYKGGILLFIGPNIPHTSFGNEECTDSLEVVVQFDEAFVRKRLAAFPEFVRLVKLADRSRYGLIFSPAIHALTAPHFEAMSTTHSTSRLLLFLECLQLMARDTAATTLFSSPADLPARLPPADLRRLDKIFRMVNERYHEGLTSARMAKCIGMKTNSFCRFFKMHTNQTFTCFLNEFRLDPAKELLKNSPATVQEVMYACGFRDAPYFSRRFRAYTGKSPSDFRKEV